MRELAEPDLADARRIAAAFVRQGCPWLVAQDAEGIVCEAMAHAARDFEESKGRWRSYLGRVARHALWNAVRYEGNHRAGECSLQDPVDAPGIERQQATRGELLPAPEASPGPEDRVDLRAALARIDRRRRLVLWLYFQDGRTETEIGAALGVAQTQAGRLKRSALDALREAM